MAALDDQIRETVNRLLDSLRSRLESDLGSHQDELLRTTQEASARIASEAAEAATAEARREADLQIESLKNDLEAARHELDQTRDDVEATLRDIETSRRESDATRLEVSRLTDALRNKEEQLRRTEEQAGQVTRLPDAVRALDEAATFGEVLETLTLRAGREAGRAAVFLVKGDRLQDWRTAGFNLAFGAARLDIELSDSGPMAEAIRSREGVYPRKDSPVPEFARTDAPRLTAAWPVSVGGSVVAVLYADSPVADTSDELYWPAFLDVLARHAGRVLEGITVRQAAGLMTGKAAGTTSSIDGHQTSGSIQ